jgi:4-amino-4-deoxy-L-arabinose transferase-like glycosyltransferase
VSLAGILLTYLVLACGYALATPRWNNPDEPAHYNYIAQLAQRAEFPVLQPGDWESQRLAQRLTSGRFSTEEPIDDFRYEGHQPPLYYLLTVPLYRIADSLGLGSNARVVALRAASIGFGLLVIVVTYAAARELDPQRAELAPLAAGIVAFIPMHTAMNATINNDALAELMASATLLTVLVGLRRGFGRKGAAAVGVLSAGLLLTKLTVYVFVPLALAALVVGPRRSLPTPTGQSKLSPLRERAGQLILALIVMAALSAWWFVRNLSVYGWPDLFGLQRHEQVVVGQPRWSGVGLEPVAFLGYSLFRSFWAQFGWMAVVIDPRLYWLFLLFMLLAAVGLWRFWREELPSWPLAGIVRLRFLLAALGLVAVEVVAYNLSFIQAQGRYLYPAILPLGVLLALGWSAVAEVGRYASRSRWLVFGLAFYWLWATAAEAISWLVSRMPAPLFLHLLTIAPTWLATKVQVRRSRQSQVGIAAAALVVAFVLLNAVCLTRFVMPYFQGW